MATTALDSCTSFAQNCKAEGLSWLPFPCSEKKKSWAVLALVLHLAFVLVVAYRAVDLFLKLFLKAPDRILAIPLDGPEGRHVRMLPQDVLRHGEVP